MVFSQFSVEDVWHQLQAEGEGLRPAQNFGLTWGAEKEGSTSILTKVASPSGDTLREFVDTLSPENKALFLRDFFIHYRENGAYSITEPVIDRHGDVKEIFLGED